MSRPKMTLSTLIEGCRRGQRHIQKELVDRYGPRLFSVALRYVPDHAHAQDVLQDSFVKIFTRIEQYQGTGSFEGWMHQIVVSTALSRLDRKWMRREVSRESTELDSPIEPYILQQLATEEIMRCVMQLPEGYRQVFNLYAVEGYRHREIAQLLGITTATSRSYYARARAQLRDILLNNKIGLRHAE
ncbi:MAG: sigma-70 family RNA polymerase sigma factor [Bacteroidota bacterium]